MEELGLDSGVLDAEFVDSSAPADTGEGGEESTALTTTEEGAEPAAADTTALTTTAPVQLTTAPGKLSEPIRQALDTIKQENAPLANSLTRVVHQMDAIRREFPGGMKELRELKERAESIDSLGPIEETRAELAGFREYDRQFMTGDPRFVETMISAEPLAFQKLAPMIVQKFKELNPEGFRSMVSRETVQDMLDFRFPVHLDMMSYALTELAAGLKAANSPLLSLANRAIENFNNGPFAYFAKTDEAAKKQVAIPEPAKADTSLADREMALTRKEWGADTQKPMADIFRAEFKALVGAKKYGETEFRNITRIFSMDMQQKLTATPGYEQKSDAYLQARDREGYKRYQVSMFKQHAPAILRRIVGRPAQTVAKPNGTAPAANGTAAPVNGNGNNGFLFVSAPPRGHEIDVSKTDSRMIEKNMAVLRDGRKVRWN